MHIYVHTLYKYIVKIVRLLNFSNAKSVGNDHLLTNVFIYCAFRLCYDMLHQASHWYASDISIADYFIRRDYFTIATNLELLMLSLNLSTIWLLMK